MSTEAGGGPAAPGLERHGLRLALAAMVAVVAGIQSGDVLVALLAPVLVVTLLAPGGGPPTAKAIVGLPLAIWLAGSVIGDVGSFLAEHSEVLVVFLGGAFFQCFYRESRRGASPGIGVLLIVLVFIGVQSATVPELAAQSVQGLALGALTALLACLLAHVVLPLRGGPQAGPAAGPPSPWPLRQALVNTAILLVPTAWFIVTDKADAFYILLAALTMLRVPSPAKGAMGLVATNFVGGAVAMAAAVLMQATPSPIFGYVLFAAVVLSLGLMAQAGGARAAFAQGTTTIAVLLMAISLAPTDGGAYYVDRVLDIVATVLLVLLARTLLDPRPLPVATSPGALPAT